jgi:hypothetical protein
VSAIESTRLVAEAGRYGTKRQRRAAAVFGAVFLVPAAAMLVTAALQAVF